MCLSTYLSEERDRETERDEGTSVVLDTVAGSGDRTIDRALMLTEYARGRQLGSMEKYEFWKGVEMTVKVVCWDFKTSCQGMTLKHPRRSKHTSRYWGCRCLSNPREGPCDQSGEHRAERWN